MKPAHDSAVNTTATPGVRSYAHRPRGAVLVMVLAASLTALLPNAAQAHSVSGTNGSAIDITPDGYNEPFYPSGRNYEVQGTGFLPDHVAKIFQCPVMRNYDLRLECDELAETATDASGDFTTTVHMTDKFVSIIHPTGACYGRDYALGDHTLGYPTQPQLKDVAPWEVSPVNPVPIISSFQCSVVAATYDTPTTTSHVAEHYICFEGTNHGTEWHNSKCVNQP